MIGHLLNRDLTVTRLTDADDGAGGQTTTESTVGAIRAQVSQPTAEERAVAAQQGANLTHVIHTARTADVRRGDLLAGGVDGPLRVLGIVRNSRETYLRLECEAGQAGG